MFGFGTTEILIILVIVLIFFGAKKLPQIGTNLGKSIRGFREGVADGKAIDVAPQKQEQQDKES